MQLDWFKDKHIFITGASDGIGRSLALKCADICKTLTLVARNTSGKLDILKDDLINSPAEVKIYPMDLNDYSQAESFISSIYESGSQIDAFVNSAGGSHVYQEFEKMSFEDISRIFDLSFPAINRWLKEMLNYIEAEMLRQQLVNSSEQVWVPPPQLKYYDAGSEIFDHILLDEKYYLAKKERELIDLHHRAIMDFGDYSCKHTIIDLGSGSGQKIFPFLGDALEKFSSACYVPIDTAKPAIDLCCKNINKKFPGLPVLPYIGSWEVAMNHEFYRRFDGSNITAFLLGSTFGNFSEAESFTFIKKFMDIFSGIENSRLVIICDTPPSEYKSVAVIEDAYNIKMMRALDWHMIKMINKYLEIDIPLSKLKRFSEFDSSRKAIVRWMELTEDHVVSNTAKKQELALFKKGKRIQTEVSRKYSQEDMLVISQGSKTRFWMAPGNYHMCAAFQP
jgi:uncharacterized SAM-dependent methyltransferase